MRMKIFLDVIGCRLNQSEIESIANTFRALGHTIVADPAQADLAIVNTCAVTVKAAADSRKQLRKAAREGAGQVIATGCWATLEPEAALALPGISQVFTNDQKDEIVPALTGMDLAVVTALKLVREPIPGCHSRTRAFIKVQDGCDNHCTYCVTRLARGKSRSRGLAEIARDVEAALAGGAKEIVLSGIQLGGWGRDLSHPEPLRALVEALLRYPELSRLRLSSIEPWDFDPDMLALWQDPRLCRHFHIPLQSGSDRILRAMGRPIRQEDYVALVETVRHSIPDVAVTADVIAGFPGETEEDVQETLTLIGRIGFADGHVFTYSPRPGTTAVKMKEQVSPLVAKERNAALRAAFGRSGKAYRLRLVGQVLPVLWESSEKDSDGVWQLSGLTDTYVRVYASSPVGLWNEISPVRLVRLQPGRKAVVGEIVRKLD